MVENSSSLLQTHLGMGFCDETVQRGPLFPERVPSECFCGHLHPSACDMTLHTHLALVPLKRRLATLDTRASRGLSIVGWSCQLPSQESDAESVAPAVRHLALVAARAPPARSSEDGQHGSTLATIPD